MIHKEYKLIEIEISQKDKFVRKINNLLKSGWELHGYTTIMEFNKDLSYYLQALTRTKKNDT